MLKLKFPIESGIITNFNDFEKLLHHTFYNELRVTPEEHSVLFSEHPKNPKANREKIISILFETFNVAAAYLIPTTVLSLIGSGRVTGNVLEMGDGGIINCPVYHLHSIPHTIRTSTISGRDITQELAKLLSEKGISLTTSGEMKIVEDIKQKNCYLAFDFTEELKSAKETLEEYEMPDGEKINLGNELFKAPEILFSSNDESNGVDEIVLESIESSDEDLKDILYKNIVVSGGNSSLKGFEHRLEKELKLRASQEPITVWAPKSRSELSWLGGSILTSLPFFQNIWITKEEYDENGPSIVNRKCFQ